tara:strand:- start:567 stop:782 length:216 start_codon:yes stop_codon:yes gene_type:complete
MGKLRILYKGKWYEYLINTEVEDFVMDKAIEDILKYYPKDSEIDWIDNPKIEINTLQNIIDRDNESKRNNI